MAVEVMCPECGTRLKAPESKAGKKAKCGKCGGRVRIPGTSSSSLEESDDSIPMASPVAEIDPRPILGKPNSQPKPATVDLPTPLPPAKLVRPAKPAPSPAAPEVLSLDDEPVSSPAPAAAGDPFAFSAEHAPVKKPASKPKATGLTDEKPKSAEPAERRYVRPGERQSNKTLLYAGILGVAALVTAVAAVIAFVNKGKPPEQVKVPEKKEEPPEPAKDVGRKPEPQVLAFKLAAGAKTFKLNPAAEKSVVTDKARGGGAFEVPFASIKRLFPPAQIGISDTHLVVQTNPGVDGKGERLALDAIGPTGTRVARIEYDGDGQEPKLCDLYRSKTGHRFVAAAGGKLTLWDVDKKEKLFDAVDPFAEKPEYKSAGLAAVFCTSDPNRVVTVSTAGAAILFDFIASKAVAEFTPSNGTPGRVALGRSVACDGKGESFAVVVGGVIYQVKSDATLSVVRKYELGEVGRSLALAVEVRRARFFTRSRRLRVRKNRKAQAVVVLPAGAGARPTVFRWADAAGEPVGALWAEHTGGVITNRGVMWFYPFEKVIAPIAFVQPKNEKGSYFSFDQFFWAVLPHPTKADQSIAVPVTMPPDDFSAFINAFETNQPLPTLRIDDKGLSK